MIAVGVTDATTRTELASIASDLSLLILVDTFTDLSQRINQIKDAACDENIPVRQALGMCSNLVFSLFAIID